mmetsp:Transcript_55964/g.179623  ORF Transcript_55964/g.179623 Transcript_55964/m.179623 type:complete len:311 (+) Transcript_55964:42-974(+)
MCWYGHRRRALRPAAPSPAPGAGGASPLRNSPCTRGEPHGARAPRPPTGSRRAPHALRQRRQHQSFPVAAGPRGLAARRPAPQGPGANGCRPWTPTAFTRRPRPGRAAGSPPSPPGGRRPAQQPRPRPRRRRSAVAPVLRHETRRCGASGSSRNVRAACTWVAKAWATPRPRSCARPCGSSPCCGASASGATSSPTRASRASLRSSGSSHTSSASASLPTRWATPGQRASPGSSRCTAGCGSWTSRTTASATRAPRSSWRRWPATSARTSPAASPATRPSTTGGGPWRTLRLPRLRSPPWWSGASRSASC